MASPRSIVSTSPNGQESPTRFSEPNPYLTHNDDAAALLARRIEPPPFLLDGILAAGHEGEGGTVAFLGGNPNVGKTYAALQLLYAVALGEPWYGIPTQRGRAGGIFLETPSWQLQERLKAISNGYLPPERIYYQTATDLGMDSIDVCNSGQREWIIEWAKSRKLALLVVDPFAFLHSLDEKDTAQAVRVGNALKQIARETGASVLVLDHYRKRAPGTGSEDVLQALRGAIAKSAWAGAVMGMDEVRGTVRLRFGKVAARAVPGPIYLARNPENGLLTRTEAPETQTDMKKRHLQELTELVADGAIHTAKEMAEVTGLKPDTIVRKYVPALAVTQVGRGRTTGYRLADPPTRPRSVRDSTQRVVNQPIAGQSATF